MKNIYTIEEALIMAEKTLNITGSIPVIGMFTGMIRVMLGYMQFWAAALFSLVAFICTHAQPNKRSYWESYLSKGIEHIIHGALNFGRGFIEMVLGMTFLGSFALLIYQLFKKPRFSPRFPYKKFEVIA